MPVRFAGSPWPLPLLGGFVAFVATLAYLLAASLAPRDVPTFVPSARPPRPAAAAGLVLDTLTLDARDAARWRFVDLARGAVLTPPDTGGWDVAVRRFRIVVAGGAIDAGPTPFDAIAEAPPDGYLPTAFASDTLNPALQRWYRYSMFSHLLQPRGHAYLVRTSDGHYAKLGIIGYYCPGPEAGCLTLRYAYQGDGSRRLR
jgi:hypothetical protein